MLPVLPFVWTTAAAHGSTACLMVAMGAFGSVGHFLLILAHRRAPASVLSPFMYTQLVWATTLGYLVFGHIPTPMDADRRRDRDRLRALSAPSRAQGDRQSCPGRARLTKSPRAA